MEKFVLRIERAVYFGERGFETTIEQLFFQVIQSKLSKICGWRGNDNDLTQVVVETVVYTGHVSKDNRCYIPATSSILSSQNDLTYTTANTRSPRNNVILAYSGSSCGSESSQCPRVAWEAPLRHTLQGQSWNWLLLSFPAICATNNRSLRNNIMELKVVVHKEKQMWKISSCWMELTHYTNYLGLRTSSGFSQICFVH